jgi:hypothetical protein
MGMGVKVTVPLVDSREHLQRENERSNGFRRHFKSDDGNGCRVCRGGRKKTRGRSDVGIFVARGCAFSFVQSKRRVIIVMTDWPTRQGKTQEAAPNRTANSRFVSERVKVGYTGRKYECRLQCSTVIDATPGLSRTSTHGTYVLATCDDVMGPGLELGRLNR